MKGHKGFACLGWVQSRTSKIGSNFPLRQDDIRVRGVLQRRRMIS